MAWLAALMFALLMLASAAGWVAIAITLWRARR